MTDYSTTVECLAINGAALTAEAKTSDGFITGFYETDVFRFELLSRQIHHDVIVVGQGAAL